MESLAATPMDPTPYFLMAYGFGFVAIVGSAMWTLKERSRLRQLLATLGKDNA